MSESVFTQMTSLCSSSHVLVQVDKLDILPGLPNTVRGYCGVQTNHVLYIFNYSGSQ